MIETKFETIDSKTLVAATQVAERMIKELTSLKSDYRDIRELYFTCIQELPLVEVGDCYFVKTMSSLKHRSYA